MKNRQKNQQMKAVVENDVDSLVAGLQQIRFANPSDRVFISVSYPTVVPGAGIEPATRGFSVPCSTY